MGIVLTKSDIDQEFLEQIDAYEKRVIRLLAKSSNELFGEKRTIKAVTDGFKSLVYRRPDDDSDPLLYASLRTDREGNLSTSIMNEGKPVAKEESTGVLSRPRQTLSLNLSFGQVWIGKDLSDFKCGLTLNVNRVEVLKTDTSNEPVAISDVDVSQLSLKESTNT